MNARLEAHNFRKAGELMDRNAELHDNLRWLRSLRDERGDEPDFPTRE